MPNTNPVIPPTVGRVLWYYPALRSGESNFAVHADGGGPYAAIIAHVWSETMVNLTVFDANGAPHSRTSVTLIQDDDVATDNAFCGWMPFQKGQAAKQESETKAPEAPPLFGVRSFREDLELSAVHAMVGPVVQLGLSGAKVGEQVRQALDGLLNHGAAPVPLVGLPVRDHHRNEEGARATDTDAPIQFDFGAAVGHLKAGRRVARSGWNGKGMFIWLNKGALDGDLLGFRPGEQPSYGHPSTIDGISVGLFEAHPAGVVCRLPNINMRAASGTTVTGWLASQTDMLAEDWMLVE